MTPADGRWKKLFDERHGWAFRAYDAFMDSLSPEVRERMGHKSADEEAYVVAFGQTQVGKTTLILDLMGVALEAMDRVSTVLRGGRDLGRSATSTAMEYRRSPDGSWGLRIENFTSWMETDEEMTRAVGALRESMETRTLEVTRPCLVCIPADCFITDPAQTLVRMLDLPGDQPANPVEQEHVYGMARQYIPLADLILLIGRSDDLTFLQPGRLTLPGIENWQSVPARFRVVTTYSFAPQDVRDQIRKRSSAPNLQELRESLIAQIELAGPLAPRARRLESFFPLEFGSSWLDAKVSHPDLYLLVSPLVNDFKQQLRNDIRDSTGSWARLKSAASAYAVVSELMDERLKHMRLEVEEIERDVQALEGDLKQAEIGLADAKRRLSRAEGRAKALGHDRLKQDALEHIVWPPEIKLDVEGKTVPEFRLTVEHVRKELVQTLCAFYPLRDATSLQDSDVDVRRKFWRRLSVGDHTNEVKQIVADAFRPLVARLDKYFWDKYWFTSALDSDYRIDKRLFVACLTDARRRLREAATGWWSAAAAVQLDEMARTAENSRVDLLSWRARCEDTQESLASSQQRLATASAKRMEYVQRMDMELDDSRRFVRMLDERYLEELRSRRRGVIEPGEPSARLLALMAAVHMTDVRKTLSSNVLDSGQQ